MVYTFQVLYTDIKTLYFVVEIKHIENSSPKFSQKEFHLQEVKWEQLLVWLVRLDRKKFLVSYLHPNAVLFIFPARQYFAFKTLAKG